MLHLARNVSPTQYNKMESFFFFFFMFLKKQYLFILIVVDLQVVLVSGLQQSDSMIHMSIE